MDISSKLFKFSVLLLKQTALLSALSCRLVQLTGKHPDPIHPKHLVSIRPAWYLSHIKKTDTVLDIGCNNAQHTIKIAGNCKKVYGVDYDSRILELARREVDRAKLRNVSISQVNIEDGLPFKSSQFDTIVFLDVLEHLYKREFILKETWRVLKQRGFLLVSIPHANTSWKRLQKKVGINYFSDPDHKVEYTKKEIVHELEKSGFQVINIFPVTFDTPWVGFIDLVGGVSLTWYVWLSKWRRNRALINPHESIGFEIVSRKNSI